MSPLSETQADGETPALTLSVAVAVGMRALVGLMLTTESLGPEDIYVASTNN